MSRDHEVSASPLDFLQPEAPRPSVRALILMFVIRLPSEKPTTGPHVLYILVLRCQ